MEIKVAEIAAKLEKDEEKIKDHIDDFRLFQTEIREHLKKIDSETVVLHKLASSIEVLANNITDQNEKIDKLSTKQEEMGEKINNLEHAPAKEALSFNKEIKHKILVMIAIGAICFFLGGIFPFPLG